MFSAECNFWERSEVSSEWCKSSFRFRAAHSNNLISICNSKKRYLIPGTVHHSNQNSEKYNNEMRMRCGHGWRGTATNDLDECPEQGQLRQFPYSVDHLDLQLPGTRGHTACTMNGQQKILVGRSVWTLDTACAGAGT